jgi:hypothetical protein
MTLMSSFEYRLTMELNSRTVLIFLKIYKLIRITGRMRQIITPLPKVAERQKSSSPQRSTLSSPAESPLITDLAIETPVPRRYSLAAASLLRRRASPPLIDNRRRQLSHPISSSGRRIETPPSYAPTPSVIDPSTLASFPSSLHSLSSSPMPLNSYAFTMMDVIDPGPINITPPMTVLTDDESVLAGFFLRELPALLPFSELFPSVCNDIWALSVTHIPLTQSVFAISSYLTDRRADIPPIQGLTYLEKALTCVQEAIYLSIVDEGLIAAVFLLALQSTLSGDFKNSRRHLQGMCQLLQFYNQQRAGSIPAINTLYTTDGYPIIMLLWRMAIRMEYHVAFYDSGQGAPIFPIVNTSQESTHIEWISQLIDKTIPNGVNWTLASFALDDLMNRAGHLSHEFTECHIDSIDRAFQIQELVEEHQNWKRRPVVSQAIIENLSSPPDATINPNLMHTTTTTSFLHYQPIQIQNKLYSTLLIRHFMTGIYLSLISDQCPGPVSPERFQAAIDICRYFVALYGDPPYSHSNPLLRPVDNCMALITAGFTFCGENYSNEFDYCVRTLSAIARETGFSALLDVLEILKATHKDNSCEENWAKGFQERVDSSPSIRWDAFDVGFENVFEGLGRSVF